MVFISPSPPDTCTQHNVPTEVRETETDSGKQGGEGNRIENRSYSKPRYGTRTGLQLRLMRGVFSNANYFNLFLMIFPRISLHYKLVPVHYRECEYSLLENDLTLLRLYVINLYFVMQAAQGPFVKDCS